MHTKVRAALVAGSTLLGGCTGVLSDSWSSADDPTPGPSVPSSEVAAPAVVAPFRQLTREEYENTVRRLLGYTGPVAELLSPESPTGPFTRNAFDHGVSEQGIVALQNVARIVAQAAVDERLADLAPCALDDPAVDDPAVDDPALGDSARATACGYDFIDRFAPRAFRRPLPPDVRQSLTGLFDEAIAEYDFPDALSLVLQSILQSPYFLYHVEEATGDESAPGVRYVDDYALASRLSYFLEGTLPDDALWEAAQAHTVARDLRHHVERLMGAEGLSRTAWSFHRQWLRTRDISGLYKNPTTTEGWPDAEIRNRAWEQSLEDFVTYVFTGGTPSLGELFTSPAVFLPPELATIYGSEVDPTLGVPTVPGPRVGLLTQPALLAKLAQPEQSNPVKRGVFLLQNVLCQHLPPPPPTLENAATAPQLSETATTRERYAQHSSDPSCAGCHIAGGIDALGFAFEHYDWLGQYRTLENGRPVDASGEFGNFSDESLQGPFQDAGELIQRLVASVEVRRCISGLWYEYALGRASRAADAPLLSALEPEWHAAGTDFRALVLAIVSSQAFRTRTEEQ